MRSGRTTPILLCLLVLLPCVLRAADDGPKRKKSEMLPVLLAGLQYSYDGQNEKADAKFDDYMQYDDLIARWRKATSLFLRMKYEQDKENPHMDEQSYRDFIAFLDRGIEEAKEKIFRHENVDELHNEQIDIHILANLLGIRGAIEYGHKKSWEGAVATAKLVFDTASLSHYPDASALTGLINYRVGRHNSAARYAAAVFTFNWKIIDLPADREGGLDQMFAAANNNTGIFSDDARFLIVFTYTPEKNGNVERYRESEVRPTFDYLFARYPNNLALKKYIFMSGQCRCMQ